MHKIESRDIQTGITFPKQYWLAVNDKILRYQRNGILQGHSIGLVFYFFNLFEEIPIEM